jgi:hypothetical protein
MKDNVFENNYRNNLADVCVLTKEILKYPKLVFHCNNKK